AQEYAGQLKVGGLDVTKYEQLAGRLDVVSIPTLILYKDGQEVDRLVGAAPKEKIVEMIKPHL
ncbi:MAG: thiol reductase thioredoxin, partial [Spirochaetaceae bacterium]